MVLWGWSIDFLDTEEMLSATACSALCPQTSVFGGRHGEGWREVSVDLHSPLSPPRGIIKPEGILKSSGSIRMFSPVGSFQDISLILGSPRSPFLSSCPVSSCFRSSFAWGAGTEKQSSVSYQTVNVLIFQERGDGGATRSAYWGDKGKTWHSVQGHVGRDGKGGLPSQWS